ncbi:MAG TPA: HAD-IB family phosphatase [Candidatus Thermoplasmatota archaeon]|nr:HAD-IB family phosphatase [Candidatus Thermoplasmatota archaeon]
MPLRVVSFDLDGTLIHPAIFNAVADGLGFGEPLQWSYEEYVAGRMSLEDAFRHDYRHFVGRRVEDMHRALRATDAWTPGIAPAVERLRRAGLRVIVTTDQPRFLAETTRWFGVEEVVCTDAEVRDGVVTGDVRPAFDKWANLARWLDGAGVEARDVAHVGNGTNDLPVFARVGVSLAVNPLHPSVVAGAQASIERMQTLEQAADLLLALRGPASTPS